MSLSGQIVVKNEFTNTNNSSRGASPGNYIVNYAARGEATEQYHPAGVEGLTVHNYIAYYSARENATEQATKQYKEKSQLQNEIFLLDGRDGRAFGSLGLSYKHKELLEQAEIVQKQFDKGHTVQKTVLSFTTDYLKEQKVLPFDFEHKEIGDFEGKVDQLKLRQAIMTGVDDYTKRAGFIEPIWVGAIQIDTHHVHAHLTIVDKEISPSRKLVKGEEKGKITKKEREVMRRGIHRTLRKDKTLNHYHNSVDNTRRESVSRIKNLAMEQMKSSMQLQNIIAALPKDNRKWRYGSNRKEMQRANELMDSYLELLDKEHSDVTGKTNIEISLKDYADEAVRVNGSAGKTAEEYMEDGRKLATERSANGVYKKIQHFIKNAESKGYEPTPVKTPMIELVSKDDSELRAIVQNEGSNLSVMAYRSRSYNHRKATHLIEGLTYADANRNFNEALLNKVATADSIALGRFYSNEMSHHFELVDKYRMYLPVRSEPVLRDSFVDSHLRTRLTSNTERLNEELNEQSDDPVKSIVESVRLLRNDERFDLFLKRQGEVGLDGTVTRSIDDVLAELEKKPSAPLPLVTQMALNELRNSEYEGLNKRIELWQSNIEGENKLPLNLERQLNEHMKEVDTYTLKSYLNGELYAPDLQPIEKQLAHKEETGQLPALPELREVDSLMKGDSAYKKRIQALDIESSTADFTPFENRSIGRTARRNYRKRIEERQVAVVEAIEYVEETNQSSEPFIEVQQQIQYQLAFANQLDETGQLSIEADEPLMSEGKLNSTIPLDFTREMTKENLEEIQNIRKEIVIELNIPALDKAERNVEMPNVNRMRENKNLEL